MSHKKKNWTGENSCTYFMKVNFIFNFCWTNCIIWDYTRITLQIALTLGNLKNYEVDRNFKFYNRWTCVTPFNNTKHKNLLCFYQYVTQTAASIIEAQVDPIFALQYRVLPSPHSPDLTPVISGFCSRAISSPRCTNIALKTTLKALNQMNLK